MSKLYLCGMTSAGNEANLRALIEPIRQSFDGSIWTFHHPTDSGAEYLESVKGAGRVVYAHWANRHQYSMNHYLYQGPLVDGDHLVVVDTLERLSPSFCSTDLPHLVNLMQKQNVAMIANYGKGLIFRFNEQLEFKGSPHWYASGLDGASVDIQLPQDSFWNVRGEQRDEYQWVGHYAKYYIDYPAGSNHCLLGLDTYGDPKVLFPPREAQRLAFRQELRRRGVDLTVASVVQYWKAHQPLDSVMLDHVNSDKVVQDLYRFEVLGDRTVVHSHLPSHMKAVTALAAPPPSLQPAPVP